MIDPLAYTPRMAMSKHRRKRQASLWVATQDLPRSAAHPFYERLNRLLDDAGFDAFVEGACAKFYAPVLGRPGLAPGRYFRLLLLDYFEGLDSERAILDNLRTCIETRLSAEEREQIAWKTANNIYKIGLKG